MINVRFVLTFLTFLQDLLLCVKQDHHLKLFFYEMIFFVDHDYHLKLPKGRTSVKSSLPVHELFLM